MSRKTNDVLKSILPFMAYNTMALDRAKEEMPFMFETPGYNKAPSTHQKCSLPGCKVETSHGYCCADHCKEHKQLQRKERLQCNRKT